VAKLDSNTRALSGLRIAVGILFLIFGEYKVFGTTFTSGGGFEYWINRFLADGAYPFMVPVLKNLVLPGNFGPAGQHLRPRVIASPTFLVELPGAARSLLAVLWRLARPLGVGTLFCRVRHR
jgi:hypothetical protein